MNATPPPAGPGTGGPPPLVIAGHGTRDPEGVATCLALVDRVRDLLPGVRVEAGFVELTPPTVDEAVSRVLADGPAGAVVVPLMIGTGGHVREDIPEAVAAGRRGHERATVVSTRHLGSPAPMISAARQRIDAARAGWAAHEVTVVFVGRGCSVTDANADHVRLGRVLQETGGYAAVLPAFIQVTGPTVAEALDMARGAGARRIVVMPHYLFPGRLTTWVREAAAAWSAASADAEVRLAGPIGDCPELAEVVATRYREGLTACPAAAQAAPSAPGPRAGRRDHVRDGAEIYRRSFSIIEAEADLGRVPLALRPVAIRMIHASGQIDLLDDLAWSHGLVAAASAALRGGAPVLCDSRMVASGIIRSRLPSGNDVVCHLGDPDLPALAARLGTTRTAAAVELWRPRLAGAVVAIGNAPTALFHLLDVVADDPSLRPAAVLGIPVGFVGAAESKQALVGSGLGLEYLVVRGRRGGSAVTVAAVNALCGVDPRTGG